jgi:1,4-alpha-glucan branching enzyme
MLADLLNRKQTHFILWRPGNTEPVPALYIGAIETDNPSYKDFQEIPLQSSSEFPELWQVAAKDCQLQEGQVYHYWFRVCAGETGKSYCTDPTAQSIDRRFLAPEVEGKTDCAPAGVVLYREGKLVPCDPNGQTGVWQKNENLATLSANNYTVLYKLPTRWAQTEADATVVVRDGTFQDAIALLVPDKTAPNFPQVAALNHRALLQELGINALELLPPLDSLDRREGGYQPTNFFAADFQLGSPKGVDPAPISSLANLIHICHQQGIRFFLDLMMAFTHHHPYRQINYLDFFVALDTEDPEQRRRDPWGGDLFKYNYWVEGYHPVEGEKGWFVPAREYIKTVIEHWLTQYHVDGLRLAEIHNIDNYDFVEEVKDFASAVWAERGGKRDHFLTIGEERGVPLALIHQNRVDTIWNEHFQRIIRQVILGENADQDSSFEWSIRKLIDCRFLGFDDLSQVVNYLTSPAQNDEGNERLYDYLVRREVYDTEPRIKLAFVCLLTAVGMPMILAGEEFADQQDLDPLDLDLDSRPRHKQIAPVNYSRLSDEWRQDLFAYVTRLITFRKSSPALGMNETEFLHADFKEGKRVIVWQRGKRNQPVIVVANFSDYGTPDPLSPDAEYVIANWLKTPKGMQWYEVTQDRMVLPDWIGREPIFPWEAKVYTLVSG